jgi:hypothetical protein
MYYKDGSSFTSFLLSDASFDDSLFSWMDGEQPSVRPDGIRKKSIGSRAKRPGYVRTANQKSWISQI